MTYDYYKTLLYRPDCGTEHLCALIHSYVIFTGSISVLEIGMGSTSISIIEALEKNKQLYENAAPSYYGVDRSISEDIAHGLKTICSFNIDIFKDNFENLNFNKTFDFVFLDAGNHSTYKFFLENYWQNIKVGGLLFLHNPFYFNGQTFEDSYLIKNLKKQTDIEILNLIEPNKIDQNGVCMIKKLSDKKIYLED